MSLASPKRRGHRLLTSLNRHDDGVLATALRTPWMLSLAATALHRGGHQTAVELSACRDTAPIRQILFASLIPAAVESTPRTGGTRSYSEQNVQRWLSTLARHLEQRRTQHSGGTQIALDQIWHLAGPDRCRVLHAVLGGLMFAAGFTLAVLLLNGPVTVALCLVLWPESWPCCVSCSQPGPTLGNCAPNV